MNKNIHEGESYWFAFYEGQLIIDQIGDSYHVPYQINSPTLFNEETIVHECGEINGVPCKAYALSEPLLEEENKESTLSNNKGSEEYDRNDSTTTSKDTNDSESIRSAQLENELNRSAQSPARLRRMMDLRASYDYLPFDEYYKGGKAVELLHWDKNSQFCPACGVKTQRISAIGKRCDCCKQEFYPQVAPAMIIRIRKGDSILLVRAKNFRGTFRGLVAGFVETGESLEECVHREVLEETGLIIENVKYFGSQPWPYPSVLMIGFTADYKSGELRLQEEELTAGAFFTKENLPELPRKLSLARKLIDAWLEEV